jgi:ABC-2 type transport system permease protein
MADWLLFRGALRDLLHPKRLLLAGPLVLLPAALGLLWRTASAHRHRHPFDPERVYHQLAGQVVIFILVLLAAIFATAVISQEMEGRTITYLLTRPLARARVLLAKFLGAATGITVTVWASTLLLAAAVYGPAHMFQKIVLRDLAVLPVGALAYGSLFVLVAAVLNRPLIYSLFYAFGWESWVPFMGGVFRDLSLLTYLHALAPHPVEQEGGLGQILEAIAGKAVSQTHAWIVLIGAIAVMLSLAMFLFSVREYAPRDDAE